MEPMDAFSSSFEAYSINSSAEGDNILDQVSKKIPNHKARKIFERVTSNPLFWAVVQVSALVICASIITAMAFPMSFIGPVVGYGLIAIGCYVFHHRKQLLYEVSLIYTMAGNGVSKEKKWWSQISENLVLGAIPLKNKRHLDAILEEAKISAVLTMLEDFEIETDGIFTTPIKPSDWEAFNVQHLQIPAEDFKAVKIEYIVKGVAFIHESVKKGQTVYVHCKAGRGRSATVVVCYLMKHANLKSVDEAIKFVKDRRPEINLNPNQRRAIDTYFAIYCKKT